MKHPRDDDKMSQPQEKKPHTELRGFTEFVKKEIVGDRDNIGISVRSRNYLLERVQNELKDILCNEKVIPYGSYYKGTNVGKIKDFDILLVIDPQKLDPQELSDSKKFYDKIAKRIREVFKPTNYNLPVRQSRR